MEAVLEPGSSGVDWSGSAPSLLPMQLSIPPNPGRSGLYIQNQSGSTIQIVLDHDLTGKNYTVVLIGPGSGTGQQGGDWSMSQAGVRHIGQVRICAPSGSQFGAGEWS